MCRSHRIGQAKSVHVYRLVSTGTMERMIYEQQMKKVDLSTAVVDSDELINNKKGAAGPYSPATTDADASVKEAENSVPFSGFLQPPAEINYDKGVHVDETIVEDDPVLASCVKHLGRWLVEVRRICEPTSDRNESE